MLIETIRLHCLDILVCKTRQSKMFCLPCQPSLLYKKKLNCFTERNSFNTVSLFFLWAWCTWDCISCTAELVRNMFFPSNWQKIYPVYQVSSATYINYFSAIPASLGSFQRINSCYEKTCLMKCATSQDLTLQSLTTNFPVLSFCCVLMALRDRFSWNEVTYNPWRTDKSFHKQLTLCRVLSGLTDSVQFAHANVIKAFLLHRFYLYEQSEPGSCTGGFLFTDPMS